MNTLKDIIITNNTSIYSIEYLLLLLSLFVFLLFRMRFFMLFFQQEEYVGSAFLKLCLKKLQLIDKKTVLSLGILLGISLFFSFALWFTIPLFAYFIYRENRFLRFAKIKLATTNRVKRIYTVSSLLILALLYLLFEVFRLNFFISSIIMLEIMPLVLVMANLILLPVEKYIRAKFTRMAKKKLESLAPTVIGVTGSYGKTSVKHILAHILSAGAPTLFTPGSVNTLLGVSRIINRDLKPEHKFFVVEMGAYRVGSIAKLCKLVNPRYGIITAVGSAHFERFKSKENVAKAKFELAEAVRNNFGFTVVNQNQVEKRFIPSSSDIVPFGDEESFKVENIRQKKDGLYFDFIYDEGKSSVFAPIFGEHHAFNIGLAMTLALKLGLPLRTMVAKLASLPQITHRLEVKKQNDVIIIDDAYNSNFDGFKYALGLLNNLKAKNGRAIIITPGMIEMGELHNKMHYELGQKTAEVADIAIVVTADRIPSFLEGFNAKASASSQLITMKSREEAFAWLNLNLQKDDVILLENDLTDTYEFCFSL